MGGLRSGRGRKEQNGRDGETNSKEFPPRPSPLRVRVPFSDGRARLRFGQRRERDATARRIHPDLPRRDNREKESYSRPRAPFTGRVLFLSPFGFSLILRRRPLRRQRIQIE
ncbi:hypothetical protein GQ55_9G058600 [Panicum hallii var. hallii]|uniref:Uncharacterized protein n=1 Tax=Panicum hallii var. hallii TaxID=1504633 RepID=A0A2T7C019_9POAL|nr:hypothetical protein GQ55_9G058600 [Panicum hallii var. hallii]